MKIFALLARAPRFVSLGLGVGAVLLSACSQTPVTVTLHSLQASGALSFVCQSDEGHVGLKLDQCPDYEHEHRRILGLVTQTATDEVAIVDLRGQSVVDVDPATPGYTFLRVGATPGAIVSTPGGVASFVGVKGLQKNGIFALPTTCLAPPSAGQQARDLTTWAACALSSAPGDIKVLIDATATDSGAARAACPGTPPPPAASPHECSADLTTEDGPFGRRKLLVALPEEHKLVLLDAQNLLDRPAGEFQACTIEANYSLPPKLPSEPVKQVPADDLQGGSGSQCDVTKYPPAPMGGMPTPGGMAVSGTKLYVADSSLPVVHVVDVADPCAPEDGDSLLPQSYESPSRVVTTSRVAVSPLTPTGKQFLYAIDHNDQPSASVMVFDLKSKNPTPLVFPGSPRQPLSAPDRLRFGSPVRDVGFVMRDFPVPDPNTGVGQFGVQCDPDPAKASPAAQYQPNADFTSGARPVNLRGVFGFAMLDNGQIPIIDVEDFDAPCRRPVSGNPSSVPDFRGCKNDAFASYADANRQPSVTGETSCNIIEPNRARAGFLSVSSSSVGLHGPTLRALPQFSNPDPAAAIVPQDQPHLLAVDFVNAAGVTSPAQVNVSGQLYAACAAGSTTPPCDSSPQLLPNDPGMANQNSLTLPLIEPRSYASDESPTVTYEGRVFQPPLTDRTSGFLQQVDQSWWLRDPDAIFCSSGVEDAQAMATEADELGIANADQPAWTKAHADYVQITGDFLPSDDKYWSSGRGQFCHDSSSGSKATGREACVTEFGGIDNLAELKNTRELSIVRAYTDRLEVEPRNGSTVEEVQCCFPTGTAYTIRASHQWIISGTSGLSDIAASKADGSCVHTASCDLRKKYFRSRVFEVCNSNPDLTPPMDTAAADLCQAGAANIGCMYDFSHGPMDPSKDEGRRCIFENLTSRFVVYRGAQPSTRDMQFTWSTTGGFSPLALSLLTQSTAVNPQSMVYVPELGYLAVVDGSTLGLALFDLNSLGVVTPSPYF